MFVAEKRATLLYPAGTTHHLFVLLTNPHGPPSQVLMVPACTIRHENQDRTCVLNPGEHSFIANESYIEYSQCRIEPAPKLMAGIASRQFSPKEQVAQAVFERIVAGLFASRFSKPFAKTFYREADGQI